MVISKLMGIKKTTTEVVTINNKEEGNKEGGIQTLPSIFGHMIDVTTLKNCVTTRQTDPNMKQSSGTERVLICVATTPDCGNRQKGTIW
eukprot:9009299-Ditylum_brightwellii.AAC.1